ncbi:Uncharacterised protein [uncultured Ruminococcus sp.]|mgnify:CR=1 FL=1|nr:Uncharacterised protein [uncultured Ruminococcus sp.]
MINKMISIMSYEPSSPNGVDFLSRPLYYREVGFFVVEFHN